MVYANKGLKRKDKELLEKVLQFCKSRYADFDKRIKFTTKLKLRKNFKPNLVILNESDCTIMRDPITFYKLIKSWKARVVGFTAKEFVGSEQVYEKKILGDVGFLSVNTNTLKENEHLEVESTSR